MRDLVTILKPTDFKMMTMKKKMGTINIFLLRKFIAPTHSK